MPQTSENQTVSKHDLKKLPELVAAKNLPEIQRIVTALRAQNPRGWTFGDNECAIDRAVRDALITESYDIVHFLGSIAESVGK